MKWQRWLLVALCLLASVLYLSRQTEPENPGAAYRGQFTTGNSHEMAGESRTALHRACPEGAQSERTDHSHPGHCPFCFVAAFSLEASMVTLQTRTTGSAVPRLARPSNPDVLLALSVQARAPPLAG